MKQQTILIVDDREENLIALEEILEDLEVTTVRASSGNEAVAKTIRNDFALILLDVQMPEMDGFEAAELIRRNPKTRSVPIIFITAISMEQQYVFKGYESGAVDYLFKPLDCQILLSKVRVFLQLARQSQELHDTLNKVSKIQQRNMMLLNCATNGIIEIDCNSRIIFANPAAQQLLRYPDNALNGTLLLDVITPPPGMAKWPPWPESYFADRLAKGQGLQLDDITMIRKGGTSFSAELALAPLTDEKNTILGAVVTFQDISHRKQIETRLLKLANNDDLTGLANRNVFNGFLEMAIARGKRNKQLIAVLFLDLDNFKTINDTMGHDIGDQLLKEVAARLMTCVRNSDLVARLGGDEFAMVLDSCSPRGASKVADKILATMKPPYNFNNYEIQASFSIGIAFFPDAGNSPAAINKAADTAMYSAKKQGRNNYQFFNPAMQREALERLKIEKELRDALRLNSFSIQYQPQVDTTSGKIIAMEALLRWNHPELGTLLPDRFIPIAEETGLICDIGEWVLDNACRAYASWAKDIAIFPKLVVAVNISSRQLKDKKFWGIIQTVMERNKLAPSNLEIEVTESFFMDNPQASVEVLEKIRQLGVHLAIDDFGTGFYSLNFLQRMTSETVKIDLSFIETIGINVSNEKIIQAIIGLAESLNLRIVAEGVETKEQVDFLRSLGCTIMQGYYFCRPLNEETINRKLHEKGQLTINT